jgi:hypothetical protein
MQSELEKYHSQVRREADELWALVEEVTEKARRAESKAEEARAACKAESRDNNAKQKANKYATN